MYINAEPDITINKSPVSTDRKSKVLVVPSNPFFPFSLHITRIAARAPDRLQFLKVLTSMTWGQDKRLFYRPSRLSSRQVSPTQLQSGSPPTTKQKSINSYESKSEPYASPNHTSSTSTSKLKNPFHQTNSPPSGFNSAKANYDQSTRPMLWSPKTQAQVAEYRSSKHLSMPTFLSFREHRHCRLGQQPRHHPITNHLNIRDWNKVFLQLSPSIASTETVLPRHFQTVPASLGPVLALELLQTRHRYLRRAPLPPMQFWTPHHKPHLQLPSGPQWLIRGGPLAPHRRSGAPHRCPACLGSRCQPAVGRLLIRPA